MVPFMAMYSCICYQAAADEAQADNGGDENQAVRDLRNSSGSMLGMVRTYEVPWMITCDLGRPLTLPLTLV